jgi:hypothetical protein
MKSCVRMRHCGCKHRQCADVNIARFLACEMVCARGDTRRMQTSPAVLAAGLVCVRRPLEPRALARDVSRRACRSQPRASGKLSKAEPALLASLAVLAPAPCSQRRRPRTPCTCSSRDHARRGRWRRPRSLCMLLTRLCWQMEAPRPRTPCLGTSQP